MYKLSLNIGLSLLFVSIFTPLCFASPGNCHSTGLYQYVGKYLPAEWNAEGFIDIRITQGVLRFAPPFWRPARLLVPVGKDLFQLETFKERQFYFQRDENGCVVALTTKGTPFQGRLQRVESTIVQPLELLLQGEIEAAMPGLLKQSGRDLERLVAISQQMLKIPTQLDNAKRYLSALQLLFPKDAGILTVLGNVQIAIGDRAGAKASLRAALALDPKSEEAQRDMEVLGEPPANTSPGWQLPFSLDDVFRSPSQEEIRSVEDEWIKRDLSVQSLQVLSAEPITIHGHSFELRVVSHQVHGFKHIGIILVPGGAHKETMPVLVEAKGVHWPFFPLRVPDGLSLVDIMGEDLGKFVVAAPGYLGEEVIAGKSYKSEGDPWDAFDGATDDLLAMLNVALSLPEADPHRVCVFGRSRGGTVALLAGIRDSRITCVDAWAAPTDWFQLMGSLGRTEEELVADGLRHKSEPGTLGGQYIGFFLKSALNETQSLEQVRMRIIASSPLYFAGRLPLTQIHYGIDDGIVPEQNGRRLLLESLKANKPKDCLQDFFHAEAGHDQDVLVTPQQTRHFILQSLGLAPLQAASVTAESCRP